MKSNYSFASLTLVEAGAESNSRHLIEISDFDLGQNLPDPSQVIT